MEMRHRPGRLGVGLVVLLTVVGMSACVRGAEPLETIREAFRASSQGLTSGIGKGTYRHYRAVAGGDWQLKLDADLTTYFAGKKYHIDLVFHRDDLKKVNSRRIIYDGEAATEAWFTPAVHPNGSQAYVFTPSDYGDGLSRPLIALFPWDVSQLSCNIWNMERLIQRDVAGTINIAQNTEGDLVVTHRRATQEWIRYEFPRRFGFNIGRMQFFNPGQKDPVQEVRIEWKQGPSDLWHIRSMDELQVLRDEKKAVWRVRDVMKYTEFEPNVKVDPKLFTEDSLRLTARSVIVDGRPGAKERIRQVR